MDSLTGVQHISVSMATKCPRNIRHNKRIKIKTLNQKPFPCKQAPGIWFYSRQLKISHLFNNTTATRLQKSIFFFFSLPYTIILQVQDKTGSDLRCLSSYVPVQFKMFTLTTIFPQIGWAVPTASLAYRPPLTTDDEFHTWRGAPPQVQMGKCWAGNRYHEQHAVLSVPFRLTYFSTRNSSTQVSASNPVLLFHCSCHLARDRRKRGESWCRNKVHEVHELSLGCSCFLIT